jgi:hypothetical protein
MGIEAWRCNPLSEAVVVGFPSGMRVAEASVHPNMEGTTMNMKQLMIAMALIVSACASPGESPVSDPGGPAVSTVAQASSNYYCTTSCPAGSHPIQYFCRGGCGPFDDCTVQDDSVVCDPDVGVSFNTCVLHGCPANYHETNSFCTQSCIESTGHVCGPPLGSGPNTSTCQLDLPTINFNPSGIVNGGYPGNGQGIYEFHPNTVLSIYGRNFVPSGSNVWVSQGSNFWRLPDANPSWWWNGNSTQINASLPPGIVGNQSATVWVTTGSGSSFSQSIPILP